MSSHSGMTSFLLQSFKQLLWAFDTDAACKGVVTDVISRIRTDNRQVQAQRLEKPRQAGKKKSIHGRHVLMRFTTTKLSNAIACSDQATSAHQSHSVFSTSLGTHRKQEIEAIN